ncbi:type II secretion system protein [Murimonas intestini]|uniref:Type IV pilus assembly protein PilA n=1 Tax=Murimonas intestini TaxID=1337051 RepID=A0AB73T1J0_9FIRM|nr:type II secretion system protein [Murimonas intestini]MCR1840465.1 type II secretion system GspH family protein [Murimonas intestini]MCR1867424.1 type II secretion system GspH family protein [Murimonas intestini]MCR1884611.1 type II secretion system GspH family protein [Murimonas intestini]
MKESIFAKAKKARENKKGFTLVELIVVLVILAILAAILVPALLGWIDKAKEKQIVLNARTAYLAAQTLASEEYGKTQPDVANVTTTAVETLAQLPAGSVTSIGFYTTEGNKFKVNALTYTEGDKMAVLSLDDKGNPQWTVSDKTTPAP